jgi:hypothetical protein
MLEHLAAIHPRQRLALGCATDAVHARVRTTHSCEKENTTMTRFVTLATAAVLCLAVTAPLQGATIVFFDGSQIATDVASGVTSDTISSCDYLFTYTRDTLFTGGTGQPIGRTVRVPWPQGVEAQAVTTPPPGVTDYKARLTIQRIDGRVFDLTAFTAKLLANTGGAGANIEIMPLLNGEDGFNDPIYFNATGYYGQTFSYDTTPNYLGSTALLKGFDTYKVALYVDFAFVALALEHASIPGDFDADGDVDLADYIAAEDCLSGPGLTTAPTPPTSPIQCINAFDFDQDTDIDLEDFAAFCRALWP